MSSGVSWFNTTNGGTITPSITTTGGGLYDFPYSSWGGGMQLTMPFTVTQSGYEIAGYYFWWDGANAVHLYDMCLWQFSGSTWSVVANSDVAGPSLSAGWNYLALSSPISLNVAVLYAIVTDQTNGFYDATSFYNDYPNGIVNGPLTLYGPNNIPGGQNAAAFSESATTSAAALSAFPDLTYAQNGYPIDVLVQATGSGSGSLAVTTGSLPGAPVGRSYNQSISATGGTSPYTWSIASGALPSGLSLSSQGVVSGAPTGTGTSSFTVQVTDTTSATATASLSITVTPPIVAITYNTGAVNDSGGSQTGSVSLTVPSGVLGGDVMLLIVTGITTITTESTLTLTSTGTMFTQIGSTQYATMSGYSVDCAVYSAVAAGSVGSVSPDAGAVLTAVCTDNPFWAMALSVYTGAKGVIDVSGETAVTGTVGVTCPTGATSQDGDWAVYLAGGAIEGGSPTGPTGSTLRKKNGGASAVYATIVDSNGSVGASGTVIGGNDFTNSGSYADNWWGAFTIGLAPSAGSLTVTTTALANVPTSVPLLRYIAASGGTAPYSWSVSSGSLPSGLSLSANGVQAGTLSGTATTAGTYTFTLEVTDAVSNTATKPLSISVVNAPLNPTSPTTDANGVITWHVTSPLNLGDAESIRVLKPSAPGPGYPHGILFTLPVAGGTDDTSFGNGIDNIGTLGLHNTYNLTVIEPSTGGDWLADNPANASLIQESRYILQVAAWAKATYGAGAEKIYLIGFSRTGIGGQGLFFHHPDIFYGVASWDFPAVMSTYDGTDVDGTTGGNPAGSYGTQDNFAGNYELSSSNLARWCAGQNFGTVNRMWIGGYFAFYDDVHDYRPVLTAAGVLHTVSLVAASSHNWAPTPGWVAPALAALIVPLSPTGLMMVGYL